MAERLSSYEAKSDTGGIESLSEKLTQDLRTHITALVSFRHFLKWVLLLKRSMVPVCHSVTASVLVLGMD